MRQRRLSLLTLLLMAIVTVSAQDLTVKSFGVAQGDISASVYPRNDRNGEPCGLIKVQLPLQGITFEGNVMGEASFIQGEYWVYMSHGAYLLSILHPQFHKLKLNLRELMPTAEDGFRGVEPKVTYELVIDVPQPWLYNNMAQTLKETNESKQVSVENHAQTPPVKPFTVEGNGKTVTFNMVLVEAGTFLMGLEEGNSKEKPVHSVTLTKDYYMGETEVTQALWYAVMGQKPTSNGVKWKRRWKIGDDYPAYLISYEDCQQFITKLNQKTGQQFRLPTEAEWEFAARGGNKSKGYTYAGSNNIDDVAWYLTNSNSSTHKVKTKKPNELELYDMSGNVDEWCNDWYGSYSATSETNPTGPASGSDRVHRGGESNSPSTFCRPTNRFYLSPSWQLPGMGLRLAL